MKNNEFNEFDKIHNEFVDADVGIVFRAVAKTEQITSFENTGEIQTNSCKHVFKYEIMRCTVFKIKWKEFQINALAFND